MSAYVITDVEITDAGLYGQFMEQVTATVESHGGKFVARGGQIEVGLGAWAPKRIAILEFGSLDQIHTWLSSPEYNGARRYPQPVLQHQPDHRRGRLGPPALDAVPAAAAPPIARRSDHARGTARSRCRRTS